jgi:hypothetical protein
MIADAHFNQRQTRPSTTIHDNPLPGRACQRTPAIAPELRSSLHLVFVERGESREDAAARYATARALPVAEVLARALFLSWADARL